MTFIGTFVITLLSVISALLLVFGAKAYLGGSLFAVLAIAGMVAMYKIATDIDDHL